MTPRGGGEPALSLEVAADAASCHAAAAGVVELQQAIRGLHDGFAEGAESAPSTWQGAADSAFRRRMAEAAEHTVRAHRVSGRIAEGLQTFAGEIDVVVRTMDEARHVAAVHGLVVTETAILPPNASGAGAPTPPDLAQGQQLRAFAEASAVVDGARRREAAATEELRAATAANHDDLEVLRIVIEIVLGKGNAVVAGAVGSAQSLLLAADRNRMLGTVATAALAADDAHPSLSADARATVESGQRRAYDLAARAQFRGDLMQPYVERLPPRVQGLLSATFSTVVRRVTGAAHDIPPALDPGIPILRGIPVAGVIVTGITTAGDIVAGHADPTKSVEKAVGGYAAGAATATAIDSLAAAGMAAGLAVPGPGWVLAGGLAAGTVAAAGVGWLVDHYGDTVNHTVEHAADETTHAIGSWIRGALS